MCRVFLPLIAESEPDLPACDSVFYRLLYRPQGVDTTVMPRMGFLNMRNTLIVTKLCFEQNYTGKVSI